jgi:hypothetical protein
MGIRASEVLSKEPKVLLQIADLGRSHGSMRAQGGEVDAG